MEEKNEQLKSIWGKWWEPIRKWFYPSWLFYELSIQFYVYSTDVHNYFIEQQDCFTSFIGEIGTQILALFSGVVTFVICTIFLTIPACFILYKFFKIENLTSTLFEEKMKKYL
ncbi:hypothetical protein [Aestuariibaculum suncheonense]|uniref:Uncharacterized protein n=1 Tax=Aestuariibaculum suncheonense TaxID=1028745 RepID=A0A8J6Q8F9_9FLAO|nr:hypothetical protein [Aestuariibaculum suncheonense]MBD0835852.1 hypothetical protein [Aestuariibaculum suncheonense]